MFNKLGCCYLLQVENFLEERQQSLLSPLIDPVTGYTEEEFIRFITSMEYCSCLFESLEHLSFQVSSGKLWTNEVTILSEQNDHLQSMSFH